jgi:hypothetical protein
LKQQANAALRSIAKEGMKMGAKKWMGRVTLVVLAGSFGVGCASWANASEEAVRPLGRGDVALPNVPIPEPRIERKFAASLPAARQTSQPVRIDDLEFRIVSNTIWPMPARVGKSPPGIQLPTGESPVQFELSVTNLGAKAIRFVSILGMPTLKSAAGDTFEAHYLGTNLSSLPEVVTLAAGNTVRAASRAHLSTEGLKGTCLELMDEFGGVWRMEGLKPGKYLLSLRYDTRQRARDNASIENSKAWKGDLRTAEVPIEIVDLAASAPTVVNGVEALSMANGGWQIKKAEELGWKDPIEIMALADSTWQAPEAGKQSTIGLGFRMAAIEQWAVRIIPSLTMVHIKSADGIVRPSRKTGAKIRVAAPPLLLLRSEFSQSVATPAILFRAAKSLTLAWADGAGDVWHVENLQPGRYSLRCVVRAEKGAPNPHISYWLGELHTATFNVDIKE